MAKGYKTGGRKKGAVNKITSAFKDAVRIVYDDIGGHVAFADWARENRTEFYRIAARLIPAEITTPEDGGITVIVNRGAYLEQSDIPALPKRLELVHTSGTSSGPERTDF